VASSITTMIAPHGPSSALAIAAALREAEDLRWVRGERNLERRRSLAACGVMPGDRAAVRKLKTRR